MTDPNNDRPEVVHHTTINNPPARSGGGAMGFIIGAVIVVLSIVAYVVWSGGARVPDAADTNVDVKIDVPQVQPPKMPDLPAVEPPTVPTPTPPAT